MRTDSTLSPAQSSRLRGCPATDQPDLHSWADGREVHWGRADRRIL